MSDLEESIDRLEVFIRLKRQSMSPVMVADLEVVIEQAKGQASHIITASDAGDIAKLGITPWTAESYR